jgi:glutamate N-acetyltransferase/amino-acid N-acetyltransferase
MIKRHRDHLDWSFGISHSFVIGYSSLVIVEKETMTASWSLARGYRFAGLRCGIRADPARKDLALLVSDIPAAAAGVFTTVQITAAPVQVSRQRVPASTARGVVICSGNANACTGERGLTDARRMAAVAAEAVGCRAEDMLVCSTGIIGRHLPMDVVEPGIQEATRSLKGDAGSLDDAAHAILTTDTRVKVVTRTLKFPGPEIRLTGIAKGAAMIGPNMATMLAFVLTDAKVEANHLQTLLRRAADRTFNCISVEGHTSTNDTLLLFANGAAGCDELQGPALREYESAVIGVCEDLARAIADDAEGISHLITIRVDGAATDQDARWIAKAIAESALVKTAIFGADPNWGRIVSAAGYAGVTFKETDLSLWLGGTLLYKHGAPVPFDAAAVSAYLKQHREIDMRLSLGAGPGRCRFWTCDLGYEYIRLNAEYTT